MAPGPLPVSAREKIAGTAAATGIVTVFETTVPPPGLYRYWIAVCCSPATSNGTTALTCPASAYTSGAGTPSNSTSTPPRLVENLPLESNW